MKLRPESKEDIPEKGKETPSQGPTIFKSEKSSVESNLI